MLVNAFNILELEAPIKPLIFTRQIIDDEEMVLTMKGSQGVFSWGKPSIIGRQPNLFDVPVWIMNDKFIIVFARDSLPLKKLARFIEEIFKTHSVHKQMAIPIESCNLENEEVLKFQTSKFVYSYILSFQTYSPILVEVECTGLTLFSMTNNEGAIHKIIQFSLELYAKNKPFTKS